MKTLHFRDEPAVHVKDKDGDSDYDYFLPAIGDAPDAPQESSRTRWRRELMEYDQDPQNRK